MTGLTSFLGAPGPGWHRIRVHGGGRARRLLLQRDHLLVHLLPLVLNQCKLVLFCCKTTIESFLSKTKRKISGTLVCQCMKDMGQQQARH